METFQCLYFNVWLVKNVKCFIKLELIQVGIFITDTGSFKIGNILLLLSLTAVTELIFLE